MRSSSQVRPFSSPVGGPVQRIGHCARVQPRSPCSSRQAVRENVRDGGRLGHPAFQERSQKGEKGGRLRGPEPARSLVVLPSSNTVRHPLLVEGCTAQEASPVTRSEGDGSETIPPCTTCGGRGWKLRSAIRGLVVSTPESRTSVRSRSTAGGAGVPDAPGQWRDGLPAKTGTRLRRVGRPEGEPGAGKPQGRSAAYGVRRRESLGRTIRTFGTRPG